MAEEMDVQALMAELGQERKLREGLEARVDALAAEKSASERAGMIRAELQKLGVAKIELAYKAVREDVGALEGDQVTEFLARFVGENPELLPARLAGGSGAGGGQRSSPGEAPVELEKIRPGMSPEELNRVRQEIARVASLTLRGW